MQIKSLIQKSQKLLPELIDKCEPKWNIKTSAFIVFTLSLAIAFFAIGNQLSAHFWLIDDHQILSTLQKAGHSFSGYIDVLKNPSEYPFGGGGRKRPVFDFLRATEIFLWGENPAMWYCARLVLLASFLSILGFALLRSSGWLLAFAIILMTLSLTSIAGVWTRLAVAEAYGAIGLGCIFLGISAIIKSLFNNETPKAWMLIIINIGVLVSVGTKETFILCALFLTVSLYSTIKYRLYHALNLLSFAAAVLVVYSMASFFLDILSSGRIANFDKEFSLSKFMGAQIKSLIDLAPYYWVFLVCVIITLVINFFFARSRRNMGVFIFLVCALFFFLLLISQPAFHPRAWPYDGRFLHHNFVGLVGIHLGFFLSILTSMAILKSSQSKNLPLLISGSLIVFAVTDLFLTGVPITEAAKINVAKTIRTHDSIKNVSKVMESNSVDYLVVEATTPHRAYEPSVSLIPFLKAEGIDVPLFLRPSSAMIEDEKPSSLTRAIISFSEVGRKGYAPISEKLVIDEKCISLSFEDNDLEMNCIEVRIKY